MKTKDEQNGQNQTGDWKEIPLSLTHRIEELNHYNEADEVFNCL